MHQENSALPESAPRRDIELESFAHKSSGGFVRRLTLPDGRWWFPADDICRGLGLADVRHALAAHVPDATHATLDSVCALHRMPHPNQPTWAATLPLLTRRGVEALLASPAGTNAAAFTGWVRGTVIWKPDGPVAQIAPEPVRQDAIEISEFVFAATGACVRRLTLPDGDYWFPAADVCKELGYVNTSKAVSDHVTQSEVATLQSLLIPYTWDIPAGREWRRHALMISLPGLIMLVNSSHKPAADLFKRWVAGIIAIIQRNGQYTLTAMVPEAPEPPSATAPAESLPIAELLSFLRASEERQGYAFAELAASQTRAEERHERMLARVDESNRLMMESHHKITDALTGLLAKPQVPRQAEPKAKPTPRSAPLPAAAPAAPRSAPEILAAWQARFEAPEEVWSVAAYVIPEMLLHGELVAAGERIGARLGIAASRVHRCLGHLRRHGCIRQVGLTPGVGCPVYVFA